MRILKYHVKMKSRSSVKPRSRASALLRKKRIERIHRRKSLRRRSPSLRSQTEVDTDCTMSVDVKQRERREREEKGGEEGDGEAVGEGDLDVSVGEESAEIESSGSDDEEGREGEEVSEAAAHSRLLSAITSLGRQRRCGQRSEATPTASQYQLTSHAGGEEVSIGGLLGGLGEDGRGVGSLRRQLATATSQQLLPPATKQQVEKAHRALAYSTACKDVGKWLPVVTHNRKADHLSFPLQEETIPPPSLASRTEDFQAVTALEQAVWGVVERSEAVVEATDAELTAAERAELVRVMGEEGRERVRESRRWRVLMSQYEARCQRERRIKSRRFHKVQRKRREKLGVGGGGTEEERAERLRATERMTLRHGRQSKWAREVLARKKRDPAARCALSEHSMRGRAITQHATVQSEGESDSEVEEHVHHSTSLSDRHSNPWLQLSAPVLLLNSQSSQGGGVAKAGGAQEVVGEEQEVHFDPSKQDGSDDTGQSCDVTSSHSSRKLKNEFTSSVRQKCITSSHIDPKAYLSTEKVGGALGGASQQLLNVHEAFAGDDVVADFSREKAAAEEREREEPSVCLPGWGTWGGDGTEAVKKHVQVKPCKSEKHRSDRELDHVIISDHGNRKISKHLVSRLPWPFSCSQQFNRAHATPIGRHWNSEVVYRQRVTPRVETAVGMAIPPMRLTDDVQDFLRRHSQDRTGKIKNRHAKH